MRQIGLAGAATATAERAQLIGRLSHHENCDTHAVAGWTVRDCIRYKKYAKLFIGLGYNTVWSEFARLVNGLTLFA